MWWFFYEGENFNNINAETKGAELALDGNWAGGFRGRASYTIQKTENRSSNADFPDSPEHLVKLNLSAPVWKEKIFASLEYQFTSSRHTVFTSGTSTLP